MYIEGPRFTIIHTIAHSKNSLAPWKCTHSDRFSWELNHTKAPESKRQSETYRDSVDDDCEVGVEENKDPPGKRVHFFRISGTLLKKVHVDGEWDVFDAKQQVSNCNACEDQVDMIGPHLFVCEHNDVH